jgi:hypothetical protein
MTRPTIAFVACVAACHSSGNAQGSGAPPPPASTTPQPSASPASSQAGADLRAELRLARPVVKNIREVKATITLVNGAAPRRVRTTFLAAGSVSLEVRDASGAKVPPMPPPTPTVDDGVTGWKTLAAGEALQVDADPAIGIDPPAGRYEIRFRGVPGDPANAQVASPWVPFETKP